MAHDHTASSSPSFRARHALLVLVLLIAAVVLLLILLPRAAAAGARDTIIAEGRQEFAESCVACHGADGKGTGDLATKLVKPPKDLTAIAAANGGQFPFWRVFEIIAGETAVPGHETHQMPSFIADMKGDNQKPGYNPAHYRVLALTHYLESVQTK